LILAATPQAIAKRFDGRIDPVRLRSALLKIVNIFSLFIIVIASSAHESQMGRWQCCSAPTAAGVPGEDGTRDAQLQRAYSVFR
jgi:hypothetical protein